MHASLHQTSAAFTLQKTANLLCRARAPVKQCLPKSPYSCVFVCGSVGGGGDLPWVRTTAPWGAEVQTFEDFGLRAFMSTIGASIITCTILGAHYYDWAPKPYSNY